MKSTPFIDLSLSFHFLAGSTVTPGLSTGGEGRGTPAGLGTLHSAGEEFSELRLGSQVGQKLPVRVRARQILVFILACSY